MQEPEGQDPPNRRDHPNRQDPQDRQDPESWSRVRELFQDALERPQARRAGFVTERAGADRALAQAVLRLLGHAERPEPFLEPPAPDALQASLARHPSLQRGQRVGAYVIEHLLGRGGMGAVYAARQERPDRSVALKVIGAALRPDARRRFEAEAEILGHLQHPGIAAVHELGVQRLEDGQELVFFAMERVAGARDLIRYAREEALALSARLALFRAVCAAVHHAHQRGVIHRDLKPGNLLVDADGHPKVIDYGVARVSEPGLARGRETEDGALLGTLQYISPEQLSGGQCASGPSRAGVDVRSDVYSLGVVLYELIAGRVPYRVQGRPITEVVREVCERVPPPPSQLVPRLARELDWITAKALAKEPDRRYGSALALSRDLERFARGEPVAAGPASARYRMRKFVGRHLLAVVAGTVALLSLLVGVVATGLALVEARAQRAEAELARTAEAQGAEKARVALRQKSAVLDAVQGLIGAVQPQNDGRTVTLYEVLERSESALDELAGEPAVRAALLDFLARAYADIGLTDRARECAAQALALYDALPDADPATRGSLFALLGRMHSIAQDYDAAERCVVRALQDLGAADLLDTQAGITTRRLQAELFEKRGRMQESVAAYRVVLAASLQSLGPDDPLSLALAAELAQLLSALGHHDEAQSLARGARARAQDLFGPGHPAALAVGSRLGIVLKQAGAFSEALAVQEQLVEANLRVHGEAHRNTIASLCDLALVEYGAGFPERAIETAAVALATVLREHPRDIELDLHAREPLIGVLIEEGRLEEAGLILDEGIVRVRESELAEHPRAMKLYVHQCRLHLRRGRPAAAEAAIDRALAIGRATLPATSFNNLEARGYRGLALYAQDRLEEAQQELRSAYDGLSAGGPTERGVARVFLPDLANAYERLGRTEERERLRARSVQ